MTKKKDKLKEKEKKLKDEKNTLLDYVEESKSKGQVMELKQSE